MSFTRFGLWVFFAGVVVLTGEVGCLRGSALVAELKAKAKAALLNPPEIIPIEEVLAQAGLLDGEALNGTSVNSTEPVNKTRSLLTGNPQKDYIYDPNLPRELNGYNLSSYPFYNGIPEDIVFKCDDLHDGFYASVPHKCQVYHHCLFGTRYDFLCANYTAFDQKTFICHFVSEVDCDNSPKYYQRNEALYKAAETTTAVPITLRQTAPPPTTTAAPTQWPRRRRPLRRRRPVYEYYYDDQYDDEEYYDDDPPPPRRKMNRKHRPQGGYRDQEDDYYDGRRDSSRGESSRAESSRGDGGRGEGSRGESRGSSGDSSQEAKPTLRVSGPAAGTVYDRPRVPPKIRRPVPIHERDKYDYTSKSSDGMQPPSQADKKNNKPQSEADEDEYYDDEYEDDYVKPPPKRGKQGSDYSTESSGKSDSRRPNNRQRPRQQTRRRPDRYEDEYEDDRLSRTRKRPRHEETTQSGRGMGNRGGYRGYSRDEPDPVPADRPGFISSGRFSSGNRKRAEDDRAQMSSKKTYGRVAYDDEEDEEEYYYDDEDVHEDDVNKRNHKPSTNGRRNDDYEPESRKQSNPSRKQTTSFKPFNQGSRSEEPQISDRSQGGLVRSENRKYLNKQKPEEPVVSIHSKDEQCRNGCEDDYLDDSSGELNQEKKKESSQDSNNKPINESETQRQISERDRLFSSRFRENQNESKTKQQNNESPARTSTAPPTPRTTTETLQRYKPAIRMKPTSDETPVTPKYTTTTSSEDYSDENSTPKFSNFRSKGRVVPPTPLINNYKTTSTTEQTYETDLFDTSQESEPKTFGSDESISLSTEKPFVSPRPFSGIARRPLKQSTDPAPVDESAASPKIPENKSRGSTYRQPAVVDEHDDKSLRKPVSTGQNIRRIKPEPAQIENIEYNQPKLSNTGSNFRRPNKPEEAAAEDTSYSKDVQEDSSQVDLKKGGGAKQPFSDKSQLGNPNYGGVYRRVKVSAISTPVTESEVSTSTYENSQPVDEAPISYPVNNNKRPYLVVRPLSNNPVVVDDSPKNVLSQNVPSRRPIKQRVQDPETQSAPEDYNPTAGTESLSDNFRKPEPNLGVNLRQNFGFFPPKRGKIRIDENSGRVLEQYPKQLTLNQDDQFTKQIPRIEITAPGPSAPELDIATVKSNYNSGPQGFSLDIPEEEYDVTLNDALQPSTLHPTRSLVDYQQTRLKSRDYQASAGRSPEYVNRGRVSYLLPAASQQVQSVFAPETGREERKDPEEYEAVVLTAPGDRWTSQRRNRPTEWFW